MNLTAEQRARLIELTLLATRNDEEKEELGALTFLAMRAGVLAEIQAEAAEKAKAPVPPAPAPAPAPAPSAGANPPAPPAPAAGTGLLNGISALVGTPKLMTEVADLRKKNGTLTAQLAQRMAENTALQAENARLTGIIAQAEAAVKSVAAGVTDELSGLGVPQKELPAPGGTESAAAMTDAEFSKSLEGMTMGERIIAVRNRKAAKQSRKA